MDPRLIMASIEQNRKVMKGQIERLQGFTPPGIKNLQGELSAGALMDSAVMAHFQGALDAINAMTEVETKMRSSMLGECIPQNVSTTDQAIEAEFKTIT
jgi:hypothetical protein